jgi:hypothetical protein
MKKSNLNFIYIQAILFLFVCGFATAQTNVNMAANGATVGSPYAISPPVICFYNFYDNGGPGGNYNNGATGNITFLPSNAATHRIRVNFTTFALEAGWDAMYIYNSTAVGVNQIIGPDGVTNSLFPAGNWSTTAPTVLTANTGIAAVGANAAEALTFQFLSDASINAGGWSAIINEVPKVACSITVPGPLSANTGPGSLVCSVPVTTALPAFNPGGCAASYQLQYRINGGTPTIVTTPAFTNIQAPVGVNVITWELVNPCGGAILSSGTQTITVTDNTPPVVTCPGNITFNLGDGECAEEYSYSVPCTDNCSFTTSGIVAHPIDFNNGNAGVMFDVTNLGFTPMVLTEFGPSIDAGAWNMQVYYTPNTWVGNQTNPGVWTLAGSSNVVSASPAVGTPIPGFGITLAPGQSMGIYITSTTGAPINYTGLGGGIQRTFNDGKLRVSSQPGAGSFYPFAGINLNRAYNGYVKYDAQSTSSAVLQSGLPSGASFPIGTTTNVFKCTDAAGNMTVCTFSVTVNPFPNPVNSLVCNDLIFVALGENCLQEIGADQVLEGGPYKCFDNYIVELDKTPPFGNGPWVPAILTSADIGKTYKVRVTDPDNWNRCSGDVKVLDNLEPFVDCFAAEAVIPCNYPTDPTFFQNTDVTVKYSPSNLPINVVDLQTRTFPLPVNLPTGATVNDVELGVKISGDAFFFNLRIEVESPIGTIVRTWEQVGGCGPSPVWVRFDDEGANSTSCAALTSNQKTRIPFGVGLLSTFDGQMANGTWKVHISDVDGNGDISTIENVNLFLNVNGNFGTGFPNGLTSPPVTQIGNQTYRVPAGLMDFCSDVTLSYVDQSTPQPCASGYSSLITRSWTAKDASGNSEVCEQQIYLIRPTFDDITLPPNYDFIDEPGFECGGAYPTPAWIEGQGLQGFPLAFDYSGACQISYTHTDQLVPFCDGSFDIIRRWSIVDPCDLNSGLLQYNQLIHVRDQTGPTIDCPSDLSVTTDPFACCGTVNLPDVIVSDACSRISNISAVVSVVDPFTQSITNEYLIVGSLSSFPGNNPSFPDTLGVLGNTPCLPVGNHIAVYTVQDNCGNTSTCSFQIYVKDFAPPAPACDEFTVVSIGIDDPNDCYYPVNGCEFAGVTWVKATTFDDGSYDNCSNIKFTVRRAPPYSTCINDLNQCEFETATSESDSIKFYCCEVGTSQMIILRVYQLDVNGNIATLPDGTPIYNECEVEVEVQDKLKPVCEPPLNVTVSCENFDPSLWAYGKPTIYDNCCLDSTKVYQGQKGLTHSVNYSLFDTLCHKGTITRTFRAFDCRGFTSQCTQRIVVNYEQDFYVKFPNDVIVNSCDGMGVYGTPTFFGEDCELLGVSYEDEVYTVVPDACFKIERTWKIINWCTYNPNQAPLCINVPNPNPNSISNHSSNLPGPVVSAPGTTGAWAPTVVKVNPSDPTATNFSLFWNANANCYTYKQLIKIVDNQDPILICPASPVEFCDLSNNDPLLWNETFWWDAACNTHDLCEGQADLTINATDLCSGSNITVRYLLFLDLDGDNVMETVVSSTNPPESGTVRYNNANTSNFTGGTTRQFDKRNVAINQKFRFGLQTVVNGTNVTANVRWNTLQSPNNFSIPELPYGKHKIKWIVEDGCGNENVCEYEFTVKDCKPPTSVCVNGLTANVMPNGLTLFISDFLFDAYDNCTPLDYLKFGIRKSDTGVGFPLDVNGNSQTSVTFTCDEVGTQPVELWGLDKAGNADFCETYIIIQDNLQNCPNVNGMASVAGMLQTEMSEGLEETDVELSGQNPAGPSFNYFGLTGQNGGYSFNNAVPMFSNYTVTPTKDDNPLNGVSTFDLLLISKHILGIQSLTTPYKMIAADANMSGSITNFDILELRKLILGIYTELPASTSWRFVDKAFNFPNVQNPFQTTFPENKSLADIHASQLSDDFVAIKVGDVNNTAIANALMNVDDRSSGTLLFDVEDRKVKAGEVVEVKFKASEVVAGYQFTLNYTDLDVVDILPGAGMTADQFATFTEEKAITTSWYRAENSNGSETAEFSVKFRATRAGELSKMLGVSSRITKAEAYTQDEERSSIAIRFNTQHGSTISGIGFELYQNQPNPFVNKTMIGFHLPEETEASLSVFDGAGKLVHRQKGRFAKGYNHFVVEKALVNSTGILYYTLETEVGSATKKMIQAAK